VGHVILDVVFLFRPCSSYHFVMVRLLDILVVYFKPVFSCPVSVLRHQLW